VADELAEAGVPVLLDPLLSLPGNFDQLGARLDNAAILHDAGVTVAFTGGSDAPHNARKLRYAAGVAVAYGLAYETAIAGLTVNPAAIFALPQGHGTLLEGAPADLVLWSGDPLEVTTVAVTVVLGGRRIPLVSRQTLLRDRYLPENPGLPRAYIKP
jgi:imidazolonepropionase-like amidohydrolase